MNEEEKKAIEYIRKTTFNFLEHPFCNTNKVQMNLYDFKKIETLLNLIEKQQKEIEELEEKVKRFNDELDLDYVDNNFIPKDKIREKIKEYEEEFDMGERWYTKNYIIEILKELLGE